MSELMQRQKIEKTFHDEKAKGEHEISSFFNLGVADYVVKKLLDRLDNIEKKVVLEFGCGDAWLSAILTKKGANVHAFDISIESMKQSLLLHGKNTGTYVQFFNMAAEQLGFKADSFDIVIGNAILHHTDMDKVMEEIHRVLKRGGKAFFVEPLGHNPFINYYRRRTPHLRSPAERPLLFKDIKNLKNRFTSVSHDEYYFLALLAFFFHFVIRSDRFFIKSLNILNRIDEIFLKLFPILRRYCWFVIISCEK